MSFVLDIGSFDQQHDHRHVRKVLCCRCLRDGRASRVTAMRDIWRIHAHVDHVASLTPVSGIHLRDHCHD